MWMMSLVLSITSALFATWLPQFARNYVEIPQIPTEPKDRARVRSFLFLGALKYKMRIAVEAAPSLLHLSVFLFFVGLAILFFTIHTTVAIVTTASVALFAMVYVALTILPLIDHRCPYRTAISNICWYGWHKFLFFSMVRIRSVVKRFHDRARQHNFGGWLESCENTVNKSRRRLKDGFEKHIIQAALAAPIDVDRKSLARVFNLFVLDDRSKLPGFVASIPRTKMIELMTPPIRNKKIVFRDPLLALLRNYAVGTPAVGLTEDVQKRCLLVCLDAVRHVAKHLITGHEISLFDVWRLLSDVRSNFADISRMRAMWEHSNTGVRVTSRCICGLLASRLLHKKQFNDEELRWLREVTGEPLIDATISDADEERLHRLNLRSFVYGSLSRQEGDLPTEYAAPFKETLDILMNAGIQCNFNRVIFQRQLLDLIHLMEGEGQNGDFVTKKLRRWYQDFLPAPTPAPAPATAPTPAPAPAPAPAPSPGPTPASVPAPAPAPTPAPAPASTTHSQPPGPSHPHPHP